MKKMLMIGMFAAICFVVATSGFAASSADGTLLKMKAGECSFKLLDSNGILPLKKSTLSLLSVADAKNIVKVDSDNSGKCAIGVVAGRYILSVNNVNLAILETSSKYDLTECRIVMSKAALQVGAAATKDAVKKGAKGSSLTTVSPTTVVLAVGAGVGVGVLSNNKERVLKPKNKKEEEVVVVTTKPDSVSH